MGKFSKNIHNESIMKSHFILGTRVDSGISGNNFRELFFKLYKKGNSRIFTVNPEFVVDAFYDLEFQKTLNNSDYNSIDGFGVAWKVFSEEYKSFFSTKKISNYVFTGVDISEKVLEILNRESMSLFLLGGSKENRVSEKVAEYIKSKFPKINLIGYSSDFSYKEFDDKDTLRFINQRMKEKSISVIDVVLVAYGHKNQEFWIERNQNLIPAKICIGVGGTFDYLSGNIKRAPKIMRNFGLEWFFRLLTQPSRILRIFKAVILFPILVAFFNKNATN